MKRKTRELEAGVNNTNGDEDDVVELVGFGSLEMRPHRPPALDSGRLLIHLENVGFM
jgi:hypothetical protein